MTGYRSGKTRASLQLVQRVANVKRASQSRDGEGLQRGGLFVQWDWELDPHAHEPFGLTRKQVRATLSGSGLEAIQVTGAFEVPMGDKTVRPLVGVGQALRPIEPLLPTDAVFTEHPDRRLWCRAGVAKGYSVRRAGAATSRPQAARPSGLAPSVLVKRDSGVTAGVGALPDHPASGALTCTLKMTFELGNAIDLISWARFAAGAWNAP